MPPVYIRQQIWERHHMDEIPCGACALYDFAAIGVDYAKIVGRGNQTWRKVVDVKFIKILLDLIKDVKISGQGFRKHAQALYSHTYKRSCQTIMCYYPEFMSLE